MSRPLIFVMGVQRSGTNALFRSLRGGAAANYNEADSSPLFEGMFLRPAPEVHAALAGGQGPVIVKPISETKRRSVVDVFTEYAASDLKVAWIYRDPVNCYASHIARWEEFRGRESAFVHAWCQRNQMALDALSSFGDQVAVVRYRDLILDPSLIKQVGKFLGLRARYRFRKDRNTGRSVLPKTAVEALIDGTESVWEELQQCRTFESTPRSFWRQTLGWIA